VLVEKIGHNDLALVEGPAARCPFPAKLAIQRGSRYVVVPAPKLAEGRGKWLELFKEAIPGLTRVAHIVSAVSVKDNPRSEFSTTMDAAAARLGVTIVTVPVHDTAEIEPAISAFAAAPDGGLLLTGGGPRVYFEASRLALHYRLPLMYGPSTPSTIVAEVEGVLMSHGPDFLDLTRRAASYVDRILRGAKPSELPVQYPSKFELVVNLKTAKAIGVTIPEPFLLRADEVIE
jgi:putative ABC transport system substrate-binding protein